MNTNDRIIKYDEVTGLQYEMLLNPDDYFVSSLKKRIKKNNKYCINKQKGDPDNKCPCKAFREKDECECGMYYKSYL